MTQSELADRLEQIKNDWSDVPDIDPADARREQAVAEAQVFHDYVTGLTITGTDSGGDTLTTVNIADLL